VLDLHSYGAVKNAGLKPDDNVVVVGTGGLGLMAIQLAKTVTGANIIAMDLDDQKLDVAKKNYKFKKRGSGKGNHGGD
jgi:propanol-preferring alcohol dehydrogenase